MKQYLGVDVGKYELAIFDGKTYYTYKNTAEDIQLFAKKIHSYQQVVIVAFEATGGYEQELSEILAKENILFVRLHPNKVRNYGKAIGYLAKTDRIDGKLIWDFASKTNQVPTNHLLSEDVSNLKALLGRREQLNNDKIRELNRIDKKMNPQIEKSIKRHISWIEEELKDLEKQIKQHVKNNEPLKSKIKLYESIKGIGFVTAAYLTSYVPELGNLEANKIASLIGVAPMNNDSGKKKGKRCITAGRANVRKVLYMAAVSAMQFNQQMKEFYQRLIGRGKLPKVAITAVMRKLIILANSIMERGTPWQPEYVRGQKCIDL